MEVEVEQKKSSKTWILVLAVSVIIALLLVVFFIGLKEDKQVNSPEVIKPEVSNGKSYYNLFGENLLIEENIVPIINRSKLRFFIP